MEAGSRAERESEAGWSRMVVCGRTGLGGWIREPQRETQLLIIIWRDPSFFIIYFFIWTLGPMVSAQCTFPRPIITPWYRIQAVEGKKASSFSERTRALMIWFRNVRTRLCVWVTVPDYDWSKTSTLFLWFRLQSASVNDAIFMHKWLMM